MAVVTPCCAPLASAPPERHHHPMRTSFRCLGSPVTIAALSLGLILAAACSDDDDDSDAQCPDGMIPIYEVDGNCGRSGETFDCWDIDCDVSGTFPPACGCDGVIYENYCDAYGAGVDLDDEGTCTIPAERFGCGPLQCLRGSEYCYEREDTGERSEYECESIPPACDPPACDCLDPPGIGPTTCTESDGEFFVVEPD